MHTAEQLAAEIALAESTAHKAAVPAESTVPIPGVSTRRPVQNRSQKLRRSEADHLYRTTVTPQNIEKKQSMESLILLKRISLSVQPIAKGGLAHPLVRVHIRIATNSVG